MYTLKRSEGKSLGKRFQVPVISRKEFHCHRHYSIFCVYLVTETLLLSWKSKRNAWGFLKLMSVATLTEPTFPPQFRAIHKNAAFCNCPFLNNLNARLGGSEIRHDITGRSRGCFIQCFCYVFLMRSDYIDIVDITAQNWPWDVHEICFMNL